MNRKKNCFGDRIRLYI